jgi:hypothetical protein
MYVCVVRNPLNNKRKDTVHFLFLSCRESRLLEATSSTADCVSAGESKAKKKQTYIICRVNYRCLLYNCSPRVALCVRSLCVVSTKGLQRHQKALPRKLPTSLPPWLAFPFFFFPPFFFLGLDSP